MEEQLRQDKEWNAGNCVFIFVFNINLLSGVLIHNIY